MTKFDTMIKTAESEQRATIETANETARLAEARKNAIGIEYLAAQRRIADIKADWGNLPEVEIATPTEFAAAQADFTRAEIRIVAAQQQADRFARAKRSTDTRLATIAAQALENAHAGIPVYCTFADPSDLEPGRNELPLVVLSQRDDARALPDGGLRGQVDLTYFRNDSLHKDLDPRAIQDAAQRLDARVEVGAGSSHGNRQGMILRVWGYPDLPIIATVTDMDHRKLGAWLTRSMAGQYADPGHSVFQSARGLLQTSGRTSVLNARCRGDETTEDGVRRISIEGVIVASGISGGGPGLVDAFQWAVDRAKNVVIPHLGRIASVEVIRYEDSSIGMTDGEAASKLRIATENGGGAIRPFNLPEAPAFHFKALVVSEVGESDEQAA